MSDYSWTNFFEILLKFVWSTHIPSMAMTLDTQMTLALFEELLMALRANDVDGYKSRLVLGIEELGKDVTSEVESDWMVPLLVEEGGTGLLGVSL